jgi:hypothetical protein
MNDGLENAAAKQMLDTLADVNRLLRDHAVELRRSSAVTTAQASLEAVSYRNGPVLEGYVDAELSNGLQLCWCLDVRWNPDSWTIEATLDRKTGDRQETVKELPAETSSNFGDFLDALKRVTSELLALSIPEVATGTAGRLEQ